MRSLTVLVVDDQILVASEIESVLSSLGHRVVIAATREDALAGVGIADLAIVEIELHGACTTDICHALDAAGVPFAVCTGHSTRHREMGLGDRPVIAKPFLHSQIVETTGMLASRRETA